MKKLLVPMDLQLFAEDGGDKGDEGKEGNKDDKKEDTDNSQNNQDEGKDKTSEKTFTQADVDKMIKTRLDRESKKQAKALEDFKKSFNGGGDDDSSTDSQNQEQSSEAEQKATAALAKANQRLIEAQATIEAVKLGVDSKYTQEAVKLADLSEVTIDDNGAIDASAISKALSEVLKRVPVFKTNQDSAGGFRVGGEGQDGKNKDPWKKNENPNAKMNRWNRTNR